MVQVIRDFEDSDASKSGCKLLMADILCQYGTLFNLKKGRELITTWVLFLLPWTSFLLVLVNTEFTKLFVDILEQKYI